jgi:hypothetical protein
VWPACSVCMETPLRGQQVVRGGGRWAMAEVRRLERTAKKPKCILTNYFLSV